MAGVNLSLKMEDRVGLGLQGFWCFPCYTGCPQWLCFSLMMMTVLLIVAPLLFIISFFSLTTFLTHDSNSFPAEIPTH